MQAWTYWLLYIGAAFNLGFLVFHLFFRQVFRWNDQLPRLAPINRGIMVVMNWCLIAVFAGFALISLLFAGALLTSPLGHALLGFIALFWLLRAVAQPVYFGLASRISRVMTLVFLGGGALYAAPLVAVAA